MAQTMRGAPGRAASVVQAGGRRARRDVPGMAAEASRVEATMFSTAERGP